MLDTDKTLPVGSRIYSIPSCSACLRIAQKRGIRLGMNVFVDDQPGLVEGVSHADGEVFLLVALDNGFLVSSPASKYYS